MQLMASNQQGVNETAQLDSRQSAAKVVMFAPEKHASQDSASAGKPVVNESSKCLLQSRSTMSDEKSQQSDIELVKRAQMGDKRAFDLLVIKYQSKLAGIISRYVSDHQEVMDVTQEAFIKAYRSLKRFRGDSAFYTWLYRIAVNSAKNYLVAKGRRPPGTDIETADAEHLVQDNSLKDNSSPEQVLHKEQIAAAIRETWQALPRELGVALTLREHDGLSYEEIAEIMECPVGTVRSRIFRARDAIDTRIAPMLDQSSHAKR